MKKFLVLLMSGVFLYGCGGGGTTASSNGGNSISTPEGGSQPVVTANTFTLKLVDSDNSGNAATQKTTALTAPGAPPTATEVRVVIRRYDNVTTIGYDYDEDGPIPGTAHNIVRSTEVYKDIQDVPYNAAGVQIGIPSGLAYTIDVITSIPESGKHSILKYGQKTNVDISAGGNAAITMNTINTVLNMTVADDVASKSSFNVTLNNALPFASIYKMTMSVPTFSDVVVNTSANKCTFTAPESYSPGTISLKGEFTLNNSFLKTTDTQANWTRTFPRADYGSEAVTSNLGQLWHVTVPVN